MHVKCVFRVIVEYDEGLASPAIGRLNNNPKQPTNNLEECGRIRYVNAGPEEEVSCSAYFVEDLWPGQRCGIKRTNRTTD
ncbi:hypothetical protein KSC_036360 [Ktedonobacter sp. SOSP1-52]|nr:hypothetical protein KSC_036360 [Ktedonobacter sp. SOSP1-52]